jgi:hypothetical protein
MEDGAMDGDTTIIMMGEVGDIIVITMEDGAMVGDNISIIIMVDGVMFGFAIVKSLFYFVRIKKRKKIVFIIF